MSENETGVINDMHLSYGPDGTSVYNQAVVGSSPAYQSGNGTGTGGMSCGESLKKKRGRPRKYGSDGSMAHLSASAPVNLTPPPSAAFSSPPSAPQATGNPLSPPANVSLKKSRGRPAGASKKQQSEALGSLGIGFTPHVITVKAGEDVSSRIMSFSRNGPRAICILSANGAISNVTLCQAATSGGSVTYEGRFEILSLSGSFMLWDSGDQHGRNDGLSVSLAGPDGCVVGGGVAGLLTAASPVQIIVGSFFPDYRTDVNIGNQAEPSSRPSKRLGIVSPPSRSRSESSGGEAGTPLNQSTGGAVNCAPQGMPSSLPWK